MAYRGGGGFGTGRIFPVSRLIWLAEIVSSLFALLGAIVCLGIGIYLLWAGGESIRLAELVVALMLFAMAVMEVAISRSLWQKATELHEL